MRIRSRRRPLARTVRRRRSTPDPAPRAGTRLGELLAWQIASEPLPGRFYAIRPGDSPLGVARAALRTVGRAGQPQALEYVWCCSSSRWALDRYGSPSTSKRYPAILLVPGYGWGIRAAFLPRNPDALQWMRRGLLPPRGVDHRDGSSLGLGESLGLLWLPPVCPDALQEGIVTCAPFSWSDGSSTMEPDPELIGLLEDPTQ